jgi:hypothetical protein
MSPEAVALGNLIYVDTWLEDGRLLGRGQRVTSSGYMTVSWYAIEAPAGSHALGDGVAYIYEVDRLAMREIAAVQVPRSRGGYHWRDKALGGGLMLVMLLPPGQTLIEPQPLPREAKSHNGRLAVYWKVEGLADEAVIRWQLAPSAEDVDLLAEQLNDAFQDAAEPAATLGVQVTDDHGVRVHLRDLLLEAFSKDELIDLAFELGVAGDDLPEERPALARELVLYLSRRGRLGELVAAGHRLRPGLDWPVV